LLVIQFQSKEFDFLRERIREDDKHPVEIDVSLDPYNSSQQQAKTALSKIFLTAQDSLVRIVPNYWKPCVRDAAGSSADSSFSQALRAVPGVAIADTGPAADSPADDNLTCKPSIRRNGGRTSPPRAIYQSPPEFSERARREKKQGVVTLGLVVNEKGIPENVRVITPLGYGLDEQAIDCARKWRFEPAEKDGKALAVSIAMQMDFHLY
jgi:TonB family protein